MIATSITLYPEPKASRSHPVRRPSSRTGRSIDVGDPAAHPESVTSVVAMSATSLR